MWLKLILLKVYQLYQNNNNNNNDIIAVQLPEQRKYAHANMHACHVS